MRQNKNQEKIILCFLVTVPFPVKRNIKGSRLPGREKGGSAFVGFQSEFEVFEWRHGLESCLQVSKAQWRDLSWRLARGRLQHMCGVPTLERSEKEQFIVNGILETREALRDRHWKNLQMRTEGIFKN